MHEDSCITMISGFNHLNNNQTDDNMSDTQTPVAIGDFMIESDISHLDYTINQNPIGVQDLSFIQKRETTNVKNVLTYEKKCLNFTMTDSINKLVMADLNQYDKLDSKSDKMEIIVFLLGIENERQRRSCGEILDNLKMSENESVMLKEMLNEKELSLIQNSNYDMDIQLLKNENEELKKIIYEKKDQFEKLKLNQLNLELDSRKLKKMEIELKNVNKDNRDLEMNNDVLQETNRNLNIMLEKSKLQINELFQKQNNFCQKNLTNEINFVKKDACTDYEKKVAELTLELETSLSKHFVKKEALSEYEKKIDELVLELETSSTKQKEYESKINDICTDQTIEQDHCNSLTEEQEILKEQIKIANNENIALSEENISLNATLNQSDSTLTLVNIKIDDYNSELLGLKNNQDQHLNEIKSFKELKSLMENKMEEYQKEIDSQKKTHNDMKKEIMNLKEKVSSNKENSSNPFLSPRILSNNNNKENNGVNNSQVLTKENKELRQKLKDSERECLIQDSKLNKVKDNYRELIESKGSDDFQKQLSELETKTEALDEENNFLKQKIKNLSDGTLTHRKTNDHDNMCNITPDYCDSETFTQHSTSQPEPYCELTPLTMKKTQGQYNSIMTDMDLPGLQSKVKKLETENTKLSEKECELINTNLELEDRIKDQNEDVENLQLELHDREEKVFALNQELKKYTNDPIDVENFAIKIKSVLIPKLNYREPPKSFRRSSSQYRNEEVDETKSLNRSISKDCNFNILSSNLIASKYTDKDYEILKEENQKLKDAIEQNNMAKSKCLDSKMNIQTPKKSHPNNFIKIENAIEACKIFTPKENSINDSLRSDRGSYEYLKREITSKDKEIDSLKKEFNDLKQKKLSLEAELMAVKFQRNSARRTIEFSNFENRSLSPFNRKSEQNISQFK